VTSKVAYGDACHALSQGDCVAKCEAGDAVACAEAGASLAMDQRDYRAQLHLYTRSCNLGYMLGCTNLGATVMVDTPEWKPKQPNLACAGELFELTCDAKEANGCAMLGTAYIEGKARPKDLAKALAAYKRGCLDAPLRPSEPGDLPSVQFACESLLDAHDHGTLGTVDPAIIAAAESRMCELGHCRPPR
jgi:TPR repeat protein